MSNLFEDYNPSEPEQISSGSPETEAQMLLRNYFELMTDRAQADINLFEPDNPTEFRNIRLEPHEGDLEQIDPQLKFILISKMIRTLNLEPPEKLSDSRYMMKRAYSDKTREVIFSVDRDGESFIPVYGKLDENDVPVLIQLLSYESAREKIAFYEEWDECRTKLIKKLNVTSGDLEGLTLEQLKAFASNVDTIQNFPETEEPDYI